MNLHGLQIVTSELMGDRRWKFPEDRFVQWGPEDESYCRMAGYGHEAVVPWPRAYRIGNTLYMHPLMLAQFKKELATATDGPMLPALSRRP